MKRLQLLAVLFFVMGTTNVFAGKTFRSNDVSETNKLNAHKAKKATSFKNGGMDTTSPFKTTPKKAIIAMQSRNVEIQGLSKKINFSNIN